MADVFVSYSREDKARAAQIVRLLEDEGWDVFWDQETRAGTMWPQVLEEELIAARCLVALWTVTSIESRWVRIEAYEALQGDKLLPLLLDDVRPPLEFRQTQTLDLTGWQGDRADPRIAHLLGDLKALMSAPQANLRSVDMIVQTISKPIPTIDRTVVTTSSDEADKPRADEPATTVRRDGGTHGKQARAWTIGIASAAAVVVGLAVAWQREPVPQPISPPRDTQAAPVVLPEKPIVATPGPAPSPPTTGPAGPSTVQPVPKPAPPKVVVGSTTTNPTVKPAPKTDIPPRCIAIAQKFQDTGQITAAERDFLRSKECQQ